MTANATASLTIKLNDQVSPKAGLIQRAIGSIGGALGKLGGARGGGLVPTLAGLKQFVGGFGVSAQLGLAGQALNQLGGQAKSAISKVLSPAMEFEDAMVRVKATTQGITADSFEALVASAKEMGAATKGPVAVANAYAALAREGLNAEQQMAVLPTIMRLTKVTGADLGTAIDTTTDLLQVFNLPMQDAGRVVGMLGGVSLATGTSIDSLYTALRTGSAGALAAGASIDSVVSIVGLLGDAGIKGSSAGMAMNAMMEALGNPSKKSLQTLAKIGVSGKDLAKGLSDPAALLQLINERMTAKVPDQAKRFEILSEVFGPRLKKSIPTLMNVLNHVDEQGRTAFQRMGDAANGGEDKLKNLADAIGQTDTDKIKKLNASIEALYIDLAENLSPVIGPMIADLKELVKSISVWAKENPNLTKALGKSLAYLALFAGVLGPLTLAMSGLSSAFTLIRGVAGVAMVPFRIFGGINKTLTKLLLGTAEQATATGGSLTGIGSAAGQLDKVSGSTRILTGLLRGINAAAGLAAAAFVGWELGKMIDTAIGKLAGLRTGTISGAAGLRMGESDSWNGFMRDMGRTFGIKSLEDAAEGNRLRNREEMKTQADAIRPEPMPEWIDSSKWKSTKTESDTISWQDKTLQQRSQKLAPVPQQPVQVGGDIKIEISDKRTAVTKLTKKGPVNLQVGLLGNI